MTTAPTSSSSPSGKTSPTRNEPKPRLLSERRLEAKQNDFEDWAQSALRFLIDWLRDDGEQVLALARARLVTGHYVYGDTRMYEYDQGRLQKETLEELADAVVYTHVYLMRR